MAGLSEYARTSMMAAFSRLNRMNLFFISFTEDLLQQRFQVYLWEATHPCAQCCNNAKNSNGLFYGGNFFSKLLTRKVTNLSFLKEVRECACVFTLNSPRRVTVSKREAEVKSALRVFRMQQVSTFTPFTSMQIESDLDNSTYNPCVMEMQYRRGTTTSLNY